MLLGSELNKMRKKFLVHAEQNQVKNGKYCSAHVLLQNGLAVKE